MKKRQSKKININNRRKTKEDLRDAEKSIQESEELYRKLITTVPDVIIRTDTKGNIVFINETVFPIWKNMPEERILGRNILTFLSPEDKERAIQNILRMFNGPIGLNEYKLIMENGEQIDCEVNGNVLYDLNEVPNGMVFVIRDITERNKVARALMENEIRYRALFENANDAILIMMDSLIVDCNSKATELFAGSKDKIIGKTPSELSPQVQADGRDSGEKAAENISIAMNGIPQRFEWRHIRADGSTFDVEVSLNLISFSGLNYIQAFVRDISVRKQAERDLDQYRLHLEELINERTTELEKVNELLLQSLQKEKDVSDLKTKFISIASHEFRTPLTIIFSSAELLEKFGRSWEIVEYSKQIERIKQSVEHLTLLIDDVLTISRSDNGNSTFEPNSIDLEVFCNNIVDDIKPLLLDKHVLDYSLVLKNKIFIVDIKLLRYIIVNLLTNAIKYSSNGGNIGFHIYLSTNTVVFKISDEGIGIPVEDKVHLFEPFNRGSNVGNIQGTGLGMSIVKRAVDLHDGSISFESIVGVGTTFWVHIPIRANKDK